MQHRADRGLIAASLRGRGGRRGCGTPIAASVSPLVTRAGIGEGGQLRHSFVSLLSANGVPVESISQLVGHAGTTVTETVYRHELRPVLTDGAEVIGRVFAGGGSAG
jgi:integrase